MYCRTQCTFPRRLELCNAIFIHMVLISGRFSQLIARAGKCICVWDWTHMRNQGAVPYPDSDQLLLGLAPPELVVLMTSDLVQRQRLEAGNDSQEIMHTVRVSLDRYSIAIFPLQSTSGVSLDSTVMLHVCRRKSSFVILFIPDGDRFPSLHYVSTTS